MSTSTQIPRLWKEEPQTGGGGLANIYRPATGRDYYVNVVKDYDWTLSPPEIKNTAPVIILKEYEVNETAIKRQLYFYGTGVANAVAAGASDPLSPYAELFPRDKPTGFVYQFPYITETNFQLNTPPWASLDTLEQGQKFISSIAGTIGGQGAAQVTDAIMSTAGGAAMGVAALNYPKVGIMDRPKLFQSHEFRTTDIKFSLFNTRESTAWVKNRDLCWLLVNQNLYNKRDFITSVPPVFYEILVPGQHYSIASCVTNITVTNQGNMRRMLDSRTTSQFSRGIESNVPDVYDIQITLTDMVMPSKNLFQVLQKPEVTSKIYTPEATASTASAETQQAARDAETQPAPGE